MQLISIPFIAVGLAALQGVSAIYWQQFYSEGCSGAVENDGTFTESNVALCVAQQGASVNFSPSGGVQCSISVYNDRACSEFAYNTGDGCHDFGGTGKSFLLHC